MIQWVQKGTWCIEFEEKKYSKLYRSVQKTHKTAKNANYDEVTIPFFLFCFVFVVVVDAGSKEVGVKQNFRPKKWLFKKISCQKS